MARGPILLMVLGNLVGCAELLDIESPTLDEDGEPVPADGNGNGNGNGNGSGYVCGGSIVDGRCFEVSKDVATFQSAKLACGLKRGRLAKADTEAIRGAIGKQLAISEEAYIGATEVEVSGNSEYHWLDGTKVTAGWMPTQPDYGADEDCVTFQNAAAIGALDSLCNRSLPYVCEI